MIFTLHVLGFFLISGYGLKGSLAWEFLYTHAQYYQQFFNNQNNNNHLKSFDLLIRFKFLQKIEVSVRHNGSFIQNQAAGNKHLLALGLLYKGSKNKIQKKSFGPAVFLLPSEFTTLNLCFLNQSCFLKVLEQNYNWVMHTFTKIKKLIGCVCAAYLPFQTAVYIMWKKQRT